MWSSRLKTSSMSWAGYFASDRTPFRYRAICFLQWTPAEPPAPQAKADCQGCRHRGNAALPADGLLTCCNAHRMGKG